ncbi:hypothetical protein BBJ28_00010685 [Nothophytophthora sp. Chile5]|nr:hypothetical protein BBJ28_00010685 [Nothophytophthora sp. Chile5]
MVIPTSRRSSLADTSERANEFRSTFHGSTRLKRSISDATSLGHRSGGKPSFALHNVDASSVRRAQRLREVDEQRYQKFRNFFKNYEPELAGEIYARAAFPREQLFTWVNYIVSPQVLRCLKGSKDTQQQILELLMVATAMAKYGEGELVAKDKRGDLDALQNIQLHTYTVYSSTRSQSNRSNAKLATNQEASRVKLEFLLRINERLPKERRVTEELLREIFSCASTISIQPKDQSAREAFTEDSSRSSPGHDRCVQIALRVQSEWFQDAILKINGQYLYDATRQILSKVDVSVYSSTTDGGEEVDGDSGHPTVGSIANQLCCQSAVCHKHQAVDNDK